MSDSHVSLQYIDRVTEGLIESYEREAAQLKQIYEVHAESMFRLGKRSGWTDASMLYGGLLVSYELGGLLMVWNWLCLAGIEALIRKWRAVRRARKR
jgi:hypothetical protein